MTSSPASVAAAVVAIVVVAVSADRGDWFQMIVASPFLILMWGWGGDDTGRR